MALKNYSYIGKGPIYAGKIGANEGLLPVGNCSSLEFAVETTRISQPDYTQAGGGEANAVDRITSVGVNITVLDLSPRNLALALRGAVTDVESAEVADERHIAYKGALIPFAAIPDISNLDSITVTKDPEGTPVELVRDTDYEVTRAGIVILDSSTNVTDGDEISVDYTKSDQAVIEALVEAAPEFKLVFDGLNEADSGKPVIVTVHRLKFSPTQGLNLIGDEFAELTLEGTALIDQSITGTGISRYFKVATGK